MGMIMRWRVALLHVLGGSFVASTFAGDPKGPDFAREVQPLLSNHCYACHGPDEDTRKADLRLDTREGALAVLSPGDAGESELIARITSHDSEEVMPPPGKKEPLAEKDIETLRRWISAGAVWGKHWAFDPPVKPGVPADVEGTPLDGFVHEELKRNGLDFAGEATRETLVRRVSLDLTGLPPSIEDLELFLGDKTPQAFENAVDRILASPHYGERWARWWMDAARYADSNGYEKDSARHVWPYRDWLIDSFNGNLPYDQFVIKQVAGDLVEGASLSDRVATGFLRNSMVNEEGAVNAEQFRVEGIFDRVDAIGKSVLGLTMQCAQCHTHKYDPITQDEYYGIFAYLNNAHEATVPFHTSEVGETIGTVEADLADIRARVKRDTAWGERFSKWVESSRRELEADPAWSTVTPRHLGDGGQKFYAQEDGSLLTQGYSPARSTEQFAGETTLAEIAALRLELLMDPYLTYGGPGRSNEGTAALSELKLSVGSSPDDLKPVVFEPAISDLDLPARPIDKKKYPEKGGKGDTRTEGPASYANDGDLKTAWATDQGWPRSNQPRVLIMNLKEKIRSSEGKPVYFKVEISCQHGGWNSDDNHHRNLGRFRFSFASDRFPNSAPRSPKLASILAKAEETWTAEESDYVLDAWISQESSLAPERALMEVAYSRIPAPVPQLVMQEREGVARVTHLYHRGEQTHPRHEVKPHVPSAFHPLPEGVDPESRLALAKWLVDRNSPTAAWTFVNRTWQAFFGTGIVESLEDLGHQSTPPSHPELLDWLSVEFMESGWDIRRLHRLIVTSRTYRQDSAVRGYLAELDPQNRLLARGARFRPEAEVVRDVQLAASGLLDRTVGGESVRPPIPRFLFDPPASYGPKEWIEDQEPSRRYRRALYTFRFRTVPPPFLAAFDAPSGEISCVRRPRSTTPMQALALLNEPLSVESARALSSFMEKSTGPLPETISLAFRRCTSRLPQPDELSVLVGLFEKEKGAGADPFLAVARVLLNLDETITRS